MDTEKLRQEYCDDGVYSLNLGGETWDSYREVANKVADYWLQKVEEAYEKGWRDGYERA